MVKDLVADRSAFDRIIATGGGISVSTGVAACLNTSATFFTAAKATHPHLGMLLQGQPERGARTVDILAQHDGEGFGRVHQHR